MNFRLRRPLGPVPESLFALGVLHRNTDDAFSEWRRAVKVRQGRRLHQLLGLAESLAAAPGLLSITLSASGKVRVDVSGLPSGQASSGQAPATAAPTAQAPSAQPSSGQGSSIHLPAFLREFADEAIQPYWPRIHSFLESEREASGRLMFTGGMHELFRAVDGRIQWQPPVLTIPSDRALPGDVRLRGAGLLLVPSLFLSGPPRLFLDEAAPERAPILVYPVHPDPMMASALWNLTQPKESLSALVGSTRSAVLQALTESRTTTELAQYVGVSAGSASQHASVLRNAGLVSTTRTRNYAIHTLTPLGEALLKGPALGPPPRPSCSPAPLPTRRSLPGPPEPT
ncbi:winged helix-turn-helix domain-containing protein [Streptomyces sp. NPDC088147]|uniref:winged helix-turn-helix domain-containing protein n=1 Tax=unclassified Streptomyces TaxID=2593676 RepID=UPI00382D6981